MRQRETGTIIRIAREAGRPAACVMAGLLSSSAMSGKRKVRPCQTRHLRLFLVATGEVTMAHRSKRISSGPFLGVLKGGARKKSNVARRRLTSAAHLTIFAGRTGKSATLLPTTAMTGSTFRLSNFGNFTRRARKSGELQAKINTDAIESLKAAGYSLPEIFKLVVSKRSLERREQSKEPLSATESDRAFRLSRIHDHAMRVFGSGGKAHRWLRKPCRALDGAIPLELLASETGAYVVESELHAIDHGMFA